MGILKTSENFTRQEGYKKKSRLNKNMNQTRVKCTNRLERILRDETNSYDYKPILRIITEFLYTVHLDVGNIVCDSTFCDPPARFTDYLEALTRINNSRYIPDLRLFVITRRTPQFVYVRKISGYTNNHYDRQGYRIKVRSDSRIFEPNTEVVEIRSNRFPHDRIFMKIANDIGKLQIALLDKWPDIGFKDFQIYKKHYSICKDYFSF